MKGFVVAISCLLAVASGQFPFADDELIRPWNGPIADHTLGQPPGDTAEVAIAKQAHLKAFRDVLAVLPELPPEERYRKTGLPLQAVLALMQKAHQTNVHHQPEHPIQLAVTPTAKPVIVPYSQPIAIVTPPPTVYVPEQNFIQQPVQDFVGTTVPKHPIFSVLAEEIPRSPFGEVPEVYAARIAHLKAYNEARAVASQSRA